MISYTSKKMLLHTSFELNSVIAVKIKHTLHCYDLIHKQKDALAHQFYASFGHHCEDQTHSTLPLHRAL